MDKSEISEFEKQLYEMVMEYEESYFEDFLLRPTSVVHGFFYNGKKQKNRFNTDPPNMGLLQNGYKFHVQNVTMADEFGEMVGGECHHTIHRLGIHKDYFCELKESLQTVVLHEMIHAHIGLVKEKQGLYDIDQYLLLGLFNKLKKKLRSLYKTLEEYVDYDGCKFQATHCLLFYLKSLDLDLRLGLPLGTVCGYDLDLLSL